MRLLPILVLVLASCAPSYKTGADTAYHDGPTPATVMSYGGFQYVGPKDFTADTVHIETADGTYAELVNVGSNVSSVIEGYAAIMQLQAEQLAGIAEALRALIDGAEEVTPP